MATETKARPKSKKATAKATQADQEQTPSEATKEVLSQATSDGDGGKKAKGLVKKTEPGNDAGKPSEAAKQLGIADTDPSLESLPLIGDVDVADVNPGSGKGESGPLILAGYWVRLGPGEGVPDESVGQLAAVVTSPWNPAPIGVPDQPIHGYTYDEDGLFTVRLRDTTGQLLSVTQDVFVATGEGRSDVAAYG